MRAPRIEPQRPQPRARTHRPARRRSAVLLVAPALIALGAFFFLPLLRLLWISVSEPELGFGHFVSVLGNSTALIVISRTLLMAVIVTVVCLLCAYPYAYLMTIASTRWRVVLLALVLVPFWTSLMARTFAWVVLLQRNGPISAFLSAFGVDQASLLGTPAAVTVGMAQVMLPFMVLPLYTSMRSINPSLLRASASLGARPIVGFLRVFLPLSFPGVAAGVTLVLVLSLGFYVTPALLGSPQQSMLAQYIAVQVNERYDFASAGVLAVTLLVVTLVLIGVVRRLTRSPVDARQLSNGGV